MADAVRAVAAMDRPFLAAWRQAAAFKQQMGQQAPRQAQKQVMFAPNSCKTVLQCFGGHVVSCCSDMRTRLGIKRMGMAQTCVGGVLCGDKRWTAFHRLVCRPLVL